MLKVRFAEMQRVVAKALRSSLSLIGDGSRRRSRACGSNTGDVPRSGNTAGEPGRDRNPTPPARRFFGFDVGGARGRHPARGAGNQGRGAHAGRAEPDRPVGAGGQVSRGRRISRAGRAGGRHGHRRIQALRRRAELHAARRRRGSHQPRAEGGGLVARPGERHQNDGFQIDAFSRRETSTTVELRDGESFAIAGLLQDDFRDINGQVPWLGDMPVLGALFRSAEYQRQQTELVIIVTPHLVTPTRGEALALPTDRVRPPSEKDLFLYGRVTDGSRRPSTGARGRSGAAGFQRLLRLCDGLKMTRGRSMRGLFLGLGCLAGLAACRTRATIRSTRSSTARAGRRSTPAISATRRCRTRR